MYSNNVDYTIKIVISGDAQVGKTSVLKRYTDNTFSYFSLDTLGVDLLIKNIEHNNKIFKLQLWDTAGQERFKSIASSYFKGCDCVIFAYDITSMKTFIQVTNWINAFNEDIGFDNDNTQNTTHDNSHYNVLKVLIGNKSDLENKREVSYEVGEALAKQYHMVFFETSALKNSNIDEMFEVMVEAYYKQVKLNNSNKDNSSLNKIIIKNNRSKDRNENISISMRLCCK